MMGHNIFRLFMEIGFGFVSISDKNEWMNEEKKTIQQKKRLIKKLIIYTQQKLKWESKECKKKNERLSRRLIQS